MIRILINNSGGKMQCAICWWGNSHLHLLRQNSTVQVILLPNLWMCSLASFIDSFQNSIRKLNVSYSDTFMRLINIPIYTSSSLLSLHLRWIQLTISMWCCANFQQLDDWEQSNRFPHNVVTAIVNSDAYHQSPLMDKWESMLYL